MNPYLHYVNPHLQDVELRLKSLYIWHFLIVFRKILLRNIQNTYNNNKFFSLLNNLYIVSIEFDFYLVYILRLLRGGRKKCKTPLYFFFKKIIITILQFQNIFIQF